MKLKLLVLAGLAAAGVGASMAVADNGHGNDQGDGHGCRAQHVSGTVAPQTFTITVTHAGDHGSIAAGSTVVVAIGGAGQTVRATVDGCTGSGSGTTTTTSSTLTVRSVDLKAFQTPSTTTTRKHDDGDHHGTTTTGTKTTPG